MNSEKTIFVLLTTACILFSSCSPILTKLGGMKSPHLETEESIKQYAEKINLDTSLCFTGKDSNSVIKLLNIAGKHAEIIVFNADRYLSSYVEKQTCVGPVENYLNGICTRQPISIDSSVSLNSVSSLLTPLYKNNAVTELKNNDITIFIFWSVWLNKKNKFALSWINALAKEKNNCKLKICLVNFDLRAEHYGFAKRERIGTSVEINR